MLVAFTGWWLFWAFMHALVFHRLGYTWQIAITDATASYTLQAALTLVMLLMYKYYQPEKGNRIYLLLIALTCAGIYSYALNDVLHRLLQHETNYLLQLDATMPLRFLSALLFLLFFSIVVWLYNNLSNQAENIKRHNETEQLAKEAELVKLRQQLQPHFLFNSLNSISALALSDTKQARHMIQQLSDFLRGTLRKEDVALLPLQEEWQQLRRYLSIEEVRFGHRLKVEITEDKESVDLLLPPLLLQPLVENAIKFGLYGVTGDVVILVAARKENNTLVLEVKNPLSDLSEAKSGTGFGLHSIQRRLFLQFGRNDLLQTTKTEHEFIALLKIPQ